MILNWILTAGLIITVPATNEKLSVNTADTWEEVRNNNGVITYVRWHQYSDGSKTRERMGEMKVDCSLKKTVEVLTDPEETKKWMSGVSENYLLTKSNPAKWYTYTLYSIPWPFNKRDLVSLFTLVNNPGSKTVTITINSRADHISPKPGIERLEDYKATWTIRETAPEKVQIFFSAMSNTPPMFPRYIQDPVIEKMFHNNLVRLRSLLLQES